jgi:hypothetical protein
MYPRTAVRIIGREASIGSVMRAEILKVLERRSVSVDVARRNAEISCVYVCIYVCMYAEISCMYVCMLRSDSVDVARWKAEISCVYVCIYVHTHISGESPLQQAVCLCICVYIRTYTWEKMTCTCIWHVHAKA